MSLIFELSQALHDRRAVVLATVIATSRSVPRHSGSKMLVFGDGSTSGSVGGGEMESRVVRAALEVLTEGRPRRLTFSLLDPSNGDPGVCGGEVELYLEPHMPEPTLYVIGTGHVGRAVAELADWMGYSVVTWDDREDSAPSLPHKTVSLTGPIREALGAAPPDEHSWAVMVTRNVDLDVDILPALFATPVRGIGLMGSARRWETARKRLLTEGADPTDLDRVHCPVGLSIGAETPNEIAIAIIAELIGTPK